MKIQLELFIPVHFEVYRVSRNWADSQEPQANKACSNPEKSSGQAVLKVKSKTHPFWWDGFARFALAVLSFITNICQLEFRNTMTHSGKIIRTMRMFILLLAMSLLVACASVPTQAPDVQPSPVSTTPPVVDATALPAESQEYRNETLGFSFIYPLGALVTEASDQQSILITFPIRPDTNVLEEQASVTVKTLTPCISPLTEGRDLAQLNEQEIVFNGVKFLRHSFNGAAAGTTAVTASYTTEQDAQCLIFSFILKTFDPANLDPKAFPTPPAVVDWQAEVRVFDDMVATFTWLK